MLFGYTKDGEKAESIWLKNSDIECEIITFGAAIRSLKVKDKSGEWTDVALGMNDVNGYESQGNHFGASVGRCANRIAKGRFTLNGKNYQLETNNGVNHLHGGSHNYGFRVWNTESVTDTKAVLTLHSPDGDSNYPGNMDISAVFEIEGAALNITYNAVCDADTLCNLTNHIYFNLNGFDSGSIENQYLKINAHCYTPVDETLIPNGRLDSVENTPMDFLEYHTIGERINADFQQLKYGGGYDHNYCIDGDIGTFRQARAAYSEKSGIMLKAYADNAGVQFYSSNFTGGTTGGKGGITYSDRAGFCLEMQNYPDAVNHANFPSPILRKGEKYGNRIRYEFSVMKGNEK